MEFKLYKSIFDKNLELFITWSNKKKQKDKLLIIASPRKKTLSRDHWQDVDILPALIYSRSGPAYKEVHKSSSLRLSWLIWDLLSISYQSNRHVEETEIDNYLEPAPEEKQTAAERTKGATWLDQEA